MIKKDFKSRELLEKSLVLYKKNFLTLFIIAFAPLFFSIFLSLITNSYSSSVSSWLSNLIEGKNISFNILSLSTSILIVLLVFIVNSVIASWGELALLNTVKNQERSVLEVCKQTWKKIIPFWLLSIIYYSICSVGTILLIIPGILFVIWFSLCFWIFVDQDIRGFDALKLSRKYMKGNISYFLKKWLYLLIPYIILSIFLEIILKTTNSSDFVSSLIDNIFAALIGPIFTIYSYFIYQKIKSTKIKAIKHNKN
jgi:hypothetical protein